MTDRIHGLLLLIGLLFFGCGLWLITPAAMFIGVGIVLLILVAVVRLRKDSNGRPE